MGQSLFVAVPLLGSFFKSFLIFFSIMAWRFPFCISIPLFRYIFFVAIFECQIVRFLLHPVVGMFPCHLSIVDEIFFCCFEMSSFVRIDLLFVDIFLIFLLSPGLSGLFLQVLWLFFLVLLFPFWLNMFQRPLLCFIIWACFCKCFTCVSSRISHPGLDFSRFCLHTRIRRFV